MRLVTTNNVIDETATRLRHDVGLAAALRDATTAAVARAQRIRELFGFDDEFAALGLIVAPAR